MRKPSLCSAFLFAILINVLGSLSLAAQTRLPALLSDNMCLQQETEVTIWGWDSPGQKIRVMPSWEQSEYETVTNKSGKWSLKVATPSATTRAQTLKVIGSQEIVIQNILIGEIWLCSGQSNMDRELGMRSGQKPIVNFWETAQAANTPTLRLFIVKKALSATAKEDCEGEWKVCSPESALEFSAVGYFFGSRLHRELNLPVGMIESAWGGTPVEGWTRKSALNNNFLVEQENHFATRFLADSINYAEQRASFNSGYLENPPQQPGSFYYKNRPHHRLGQLYNGMIHPLLNFALRGVIWYQGESNRNHPERYAKQFPNLINNWREDWQRGHFPFYFAQIAPYQYNEAFATPGLWEAQKAALELPNTGMAPTQDLGEPFDIHPILKEEVGRRLALIALNKTYEKTEVVHTGPTLKALTYDKNTARLDFEPNGGTLFSAGNRIGPLKPFYVADSQQVFYAATVRQEGNSIYLSSPEIKKIIAVRYLWHNNTNPTLYNSYGFPVMGFRTDSWEEAIYAEDLK